VEEVEDNYHALKDRIHVIEVNHDAIEELEESVEELNERLDEIEDLIKVHSTQWDTWHGRFTWFGEVIFKCAWVLGMGWLLYKFGLGGVNFAP
jgi:predicted nuclease with TOPRIM domain